MKIGTDSDCWSVPNGQLLKVELETVAFTSLSALAFSANPWTLSPPVLLFFYRRTSVFIRFYQVLCVFFCNWCWRFDSVVPGEVAIFLFWFCNFIYFVSLGRMSDVDLPGCWRSLSLGWQEKLGNRCEAGAARLLSRPLSFAASLLCFLYFFFFFFFFFFNPFLPNGKGKRTRLVTHTLPCLAGPTPDLTSFLQGISNRCCVILIGWTAGDTGFSGILSSFFLSFQRCFPGIDQDSNGFYEALSGFCYQQIFTGSVTCRSWMLQGVATATLLASSRLFEYVKGKRIPGDARHQRQVEGRLAGRF